MKIGIISDIHGNFVALKAVYEKIKNCPIILNAGDLTGYYPDINPVIDFVREKKIISISGNHDRYLLGRNLPDSLESIRESFQNSITVLNPENKKYLKELPKSLKIEIEGLRIGVFHGSPWDPDERIYPDSDLSGFGKCDYDVIILGHTHWPIIKKINKLLLINPGSIGQPRDYNSKSSYAILDTTKMVAQINRVSYNIDAVCAKIKKLKLDPGLCAMLKKEKNV